MKTENIFHQLFDLRAYIDQDLLNAWLSFQPAALEWFSDLSKETTKEGLESSTARALSTGVRGEHGPVSLYDEWARRQVQRITTHQALLASLSTREGFEMWHRELADTLARHWRKRVEANNEALKHQEGDAFLPVCAELSIAHRYKMVDLFVRFQRTRASAHPELARACYEFGHIPLDRKSLAVLSEMVGGPALGKALSMGDVKTEKQYQTYQRYARAICAVSGGTPLLLDVFCWRSDVAKALYTKKPKVETRISRKRQANKRK